MTFDELLIVHGPWADKNFPDAVAWMPVMGISEELGEYAEALNKGDRGACLDGLGDMTVFLADFVRRTGVAEELDAGTRGGPIVCVMGSPLERLTVAVGGLSHAWLKHEQRIRAPASERRAKVVRAALTLLGTIDRVCAGVHGIAHEEVIDMVWAEVSVRDWTANNVTGVAS